MLNNILFCKEKARNVEMAAESCIYSTCTMWPLNHLPTTPQIWVQGAKSMVDKFH